MFWEAVKSGMGTLAHWQTYLATLLYLALSLSPLLVIAPAINRNRTPTDSTLIIYMVLLPLFQAFALVVFIITLAPIILGQSDQAAWSLPWQLLQHEPVKILLLLGKLILAAYVLLLIRVPMLQTLVLSGFALILLLNSFPALNPTFNLDELRVWPGFLFMMGLLFFSTLIGWLGILITTVLGSMIEIHFKGRGILFTISVASSFGFIPLFIYGAWIGMLFR